MTFEGWYNVNGVRLGGSGLIVTVYSDMKLYAGWEATVTYTGEHIDSSSATFIVGEPFGKLLVPQHVESIFSGWKDQSGDEVTDDDVCNGNVTLTAVWDNAGDGKAIVTFSIDEGYIEGAKVITVDKGTLWGDIEEKPTVGREGHSGQWKIGEEAVADSYVVTGDVLAMMDWTKNQHMYKFGPGDLTPCQYGDEITAPLNDTPNFYTWVSTSEPTIVLEAGQKIKMPDRDLEFEPKYYETGNVIVSVYDRNGNAIENAKVSISLSADKTVADFTNNEGKAFFDSIRYGAYNISVKYTLKLSGDVVEQTKAVTVNKGETAVVVGMNDIAVNTELIATNTNVMSVDNLDKAISMTAEDETVVETKITMKATVLSSGSAAEGQINNIKESGDNIGLVVDVKIVQEDKDAGGNVKSTKQITETAEIQTILFDVAGRVSGSVDKVIVYHHHTGEDGNSVVTKLTKVSDAMVAAEYGDGCYYIEVVNGIPYVAVCLKNFSAIAFGTSEEAVSPHEHTYSDDVEYISDGSSGHHVKKTCTDCGYVFVGGTVAHNMSGNVCVDCGYEMSSSSGGSSVDVTGVELERHTISTAVGESFSLNFRVLPLNASDKRVLWSTSDESIATVSNGKVVAVSVGTVDITVTTRDGSFTDTCTIMVEEVFEDIYLEDGAVSVLIPASVAESMGIGRSSDVTLDAYTVDMPLPNIPESAVAYHVAIMVDGTEMTAFDGPVSISVEYMPILGEDVSKTAVYAVSDDGKDVRNLGAEYDADAGVFTFSTAGDFVFVISAEEIKPVPGMDYTMVVCIVIIVLVILAIAYALYRKSKAQ